LFAGLARDAWASVNLIRFEATPQRDGSILVLWETATEIDTIGYRLTRSQSIAGPWTQVVNKQPARGDAASGALYTYQDADVTAGTRYYYLLEALSQGGVSDQFGPLVAQAILPTERLRVYLPLVLRPR